MTTEQLLGLMLMIGGLMLVVGIGYAVRLVRRKAQILEDRGLAATATIVRIDEREKSAEHGTVIEHWSVIEWIDAAGATRQYTWPSTNRSVGDRIDIVYDPEDLRRVHVEGVRTGPFAKAWLVLIVALAVIAVVLGAMLLLEMIE